MSRVQEATAKFVPRMNPFLKRSGKAPARVTSERMYCVDDVHSRDDLLRQMAEANSITPG